MKKLLFLAIVLFTQTMFAQEYIITKISGGAVTMNGKTLKPESRLKPTDKITFADKTTKIALFDSKLGKDYYILPKKALTATVKELISGSKGGNTRNGAINNRLDVN